MSEDLDSMATRLKEVRTALKGALGRPNVTMRDNVAVIRGKIGQWTHNMMNRNQASHEQTAPQVLAQQQGRPPQEAGSLLGQGRPTILGSLFGGPQQQPQVSAEQAELMQEEQLMAEREQQRVFDERQKLAKLKRQKGLSLG